jgi:hypothetical protein
VNQVHGSSEAELRVFLVIAGVGQIIGLAEFHQPRIFDPAVLFVVGLRGKHGLGAALEADAIRALRIAEAGDAALVLSPVEHDEPAVVTNHGGVEGPGRFPSVTLRGHDGIVRRAMPRAQSTFWCGGSSRAAENKTSREDRAFRTRMAQSPE